MSNQFRYIATRVLIGLLIGIGMFYFRAAHAAAVTPPSCPTGQAAVLKVSSSTIFDATTSGTAPAIGTVINPPTLDGVKALHRSWTPVGSYAGGTAGTAAERVWCEPATGSEPLNTRSDAARSGCAAGFQGFSSLSTAWQCAACPSPKVIINGQCVDPPACNKPAGELIGEWAVSSAAVPGSNQRCQQATNCLVESYPSLDLSDDGGGMTALVQRYTGQTCPSSNPPPEPQATTPKATLTRSGQSVQSGNGTLSIVKWVNAAVDLSVPYTAHNGQSALGNGRFARNPGASATTPDGSSVTVTVFSVGGAQIQLYGTTVDSIQNLNARYQSGGPAGGGAPAGDLAPIPGDTTINGPVTSTVTNVTMQNGTTTVVTNNYNSVTNTTTVTTTTSGSGGPTTSTTTAPTPGPPVNNPPPRQPQVPERGGGGCTGSGCGNGDPGGDLGPITDTPFGDAAVDYDQKYPDGLVGVWEAKKGDLMNSAFIQSVAGMFPSIGGGGSCPEWSFNLNFGRHANFGSQSISVPCFVWDIIGLIFLITATFTARRIIFGG